MVKTTDNHWYIASCDPQIEPVSRCCIDDKVIYTPLEQQTESLSVTLKNEAVAGCWPFRFLRDASLEYGGSMDENYLPSFEKCMDQRDHGDIIAVSVSGSLPVDGMDLLKSILHADLLFLHPAKGSVNLGAIAAILSRDERLSAEHFPEFRQRSLSRKDMFKVISDGDILLHHPYDSFDAVIRLLNQAADDPDVVSISMTMYRLTDHSPLTDALLRAVKHGKQVFVLA